MFILASADFSCPADLFSSKKWASINSYLLDLFLLVVYFSFHLGQKEIALLYIT